MDLKDIQKLSLPIPQFDRDLNLVRFKAIFELLQELQNDIVDNVQIMKAEVEEYSPRVQSLEDEQSIQRGEIDALEDKTPQEYKTTSSVEFANLKLPSTADVNSFLSALDTHKTKMESWVPQELQPGSHVVFSQLTLSTLLLDGRNVDTVLDEKLNKTTYDDFKENFDLEGDF